jgi:hypothetical protein
LVRFIYVSSGQLAHITKGKHDMTIENINPKIVAGTVVCPDGWQLKHLRGAKPTVSNVIEGGALVDCTDWHMADFRLPTGHAEPLITTIAVNVQVTGRVRHYGRYEELGSFWMRGKVTWVHDGEPNETSGCWLHFK